MTRWEYRTAYAENGRKEEVLAQLGNDGWEVISLQNSVGFVASLRDHGIYQEGYWAGSPCRAGYWVFECKRRREDGPC